ncbi:DUF4271 domain-containing protein [Segetibacter koreensis]|uniref:DUF4271 domain-containing protein n=1 Tax=Segetibacter koreensis TaxID=398037 RepID=UPI00146CC112|nr:DUF4271 domain-containing protein [Segetibacter koreensis]
MKKILFIFYFCFVSFCAFAQTDTGNASTDTLSRASRSVTAKKVKRRAVTDSVNRYAVSDTSGVVDSVPRVDSSVPVFSDTGRRPVDTAKISIPVVSIKRPFDSIYRRLLDNPYITKAKPIYLVINVKQRHYKDEVFYLLCGLLLFLAFIRLVFNRYFKNIFKLFFQPSFRQKQTREQLLQNNFPSLLLNLFFIFSAATYTTFLLQYSHLTNIGFWWLLLYTNAALLALYIGKYILLSFAGWVFNVKEATEAYIFAVYLINKILGVALIPFILLLAFAQPAIINISITTSLLIIFLLFIYRYLVSYAPIRREVKVSMLHFFFYICAFEIIPLLLIYKTLIIFLDNSH